MTMASRLGLRAFRRIASAEDRRKVIELAVALAAKQK
jgi:hypothetical protein